MGWPKGRQLSKAHRQRISRAKTGAPRRAPAIVAQETSLTSSAKFARDDRGTALARTVTEKRRAR
jgi:hypothetical protein